jgi:hypothetical protein
LLFEPQSPDWLAIPNEVDELWTSVSYVYLNERLVNLGLAPEGPASAGGPLALAPNVSLTASSPLGYLAEPV